LKRTATGANPTSAFDPNRTFGNFAIFATIRRASSLVSSLAGLVMTQRNKTLGRKNLYQRENYSFSGRHGLLYD
jgi:hypothetical protein